MTHIALKAAHIAAATLNNPFGVGTLSLALVFVPIIGMHLVHKYGWQHWQPFDKGHHVQYNYIVGKGGRRFKSFYPDCIIHNGKMHFYSVEYWQENWETLMTRVENGETIGVENENGDRAVMIPADDELLRIYTEQNNEAS